MEFQNISFGSFAFSPVFLSFMACVFLSFGRYKNKTISNKIVLIVPLSFLICFAYPLIKVYITNSYRMFDDFYLYCFISSLVAVAINYIFLFLMRLKNERA